MKKLRYPAILLLLFSYSLQAQIGTDTYQIKRVEPDNLIPGTTNVVTITLDKELLESDDVVHATLWNYEYYNDYWYVIFSASDIIWSDSTISASFDINPYPHEPGLLAVYIHNVDSGYQDSISYSPLNIGAGIYSINPEICMVSVDSSDRNVVVWDPLQEDFLDSVIIYKETSISDEFVRIGRKSFADTPLFTDGTSAQARNSNRYKIAYLDTDGVESDLSESHKTLHLTLNEGVGGSVNLIWENYQGFDYSTFYIYRGSTKENMMKIAEIASNLFTFSDLTPPLGNLYYQVVIENPSPCAIGDLKSTENSFSYSKSNIVDNVNLSTRNLEKVYFVTLYPNPTSGKVYFKLDDTLLTDFDVTIFDPAGRFVYWSDGMRNGDNIDVSALRSGMYFIRIRSDTYSKYISLIRQ